MRLVALSRDGGLSLVRLRKSVAFDRLLARLFAVAPDRWVLKGGLALDYRLGGKARTTMDVDLAGARDEDAATADLLAIGELRASHTCRARQNTWSILASGVCSLVAPRRPDVRVRLDPAPSNAPGRGP